MKKPKLNKPSLPKGIPLKRRKAPEERVQEALQNVPRITNETVAEHREEVLSSARKFIYPLQHSKHRVVRISAIIVVSALVFFFIYCGLAIYKFQSTNSFIYGVSKVIPFPVAKVGSSWVSYESYLFELRRNMHYYHTQQSVNFNDKLGQSQLDSLRKQAMDQVITDAVVKQLASKNKVAVTSQQVEERVALVRNQNRIGSNNRVFNDVLNKFFGWNAADFKRSLHQQMLQQAVVAKLDTATNQRADVAYAQLKNGADFAVVAKQSSEDPASKDNGGLYGFAITPNDANISPVITQKLFATPVGQITPIVNSGFRLDILKVNSGDKASVNASHIQFNFQPITVYTKPILSKDKPSKFISLPN